MRARAMSWGRWPCHEPSAVLSLSDRFAALPAHAPRPMLAYGNGRSYGDVCLN